MRTDVVAVIPAYEASATVGDVVAGTRRRLSRVIVVDDGSHDATGARAAAAGAEVLVHDDNRGKGMALRTAFAALARDAVTRALTLDADGQHLPAEIPTLLAASDAHPGAFVVGERRKAGHTIRLLNRVGNRIADGLLRWLSGRALPDTQSGFRVYPVAATLALGARGERFDFEAEVLLRAARRQAAIVGVPVTVHYPPPHERVSHYRPGPDTLRIIATVLRVLAEGR